MLEEKYSKEVAAILSRFTHKQSAILPLMHLAQQAHGYLSPAAMKEVADLVEVDVTHVLSLAGFYTLYYEQPVGHSVLEVCDDLACALRGADEFLKLVCEKLDVEPGQTTEDGLFTVLPVMCLGGCDRAPLLQCNLKFYENMDEAKLDELIAARRALAESGADEETVVERIMRYAVRD